MTKLLGFIAVLLTALISQSQAAYLTDADFPDLVTITARGGTMRDLLNDSKLFSPELGEQISTAINNGDLANLNSAIFKDSGFRIQNSVDATKLFKLDLSGESTGITQTFKFANTVNSSITFPATAADFVVLRSDAATLANKSIDAGLNTIANITNSSIASAGVANIARNKLAAGTANQAVVNDGSGNLSGVSPGASGNMLLSNGTSWLATPLSAQITQTAQSSASTNFLYVGKNGSDGNNCSIFAPCLTIQKAINVVSANADNSMTIPYVILVGPGTYTENPTFASTTLVDITLQGFNEAAINGTLTSTANNDNLTNLAVIGFTLNGNASAAINFVGASAGTHFCNGDCLFRDDTIQGAGNIFRNLDFLNFYEGTYVDTTTTFTNVTAAGFLTRDYVTFNNALVLVSNSGLNSPVSFGGFTHGNGTSVYFEGANSSAIAITVDAFSYLQLRTASRIGDSGSLITVNGDIECYAGSNIRSDLKLNPGATFEDHNCALTNGAVLNDQSGGGHALDNIAPYLGFTPGNSSQWNTVPTQTATALDLFATRGIVKSQSANQILASPNGSAGLLSPRALQNADLPTSGVVSGTYTSANITVDNRGIIHAAANGSGANSLNITTTSTSVSLANSNDVVILDTSTGAIQLTLQSSASATPKPYYIVVDGNYPVTVTASGGDTFLGATSQTLAPDQAGVTLIPSGGTKWYAF